MATKNKSEISVTYTANVKKFIKSMDKAIDSVEKLNSTDATVKIEAKDDASNVIEKVEAELENIDGTDAEVEIEAEDKATREINKVASELAGFPDSVETEIKADDNATKKLKTVEMTLTRVDGKKGTVDIFGNDDASDEIDKVEKGLKKIDGTTATVGIDFKGGEIPTGAEGGGDGDDEAFGAVGVGAGAIALAKKSIPAIGGVALATKSLTTFTGAVKDSNTATQSFSRAGLETNIEMQELTNIALQLSREGYGTLDETVAGVQRTIRTFGDGVATQDELLGASKKVMNIYQKGYLDLDSIQQIATVSSDQFGLSVDDTMDIIQASSSLVRDYGKNADDIADSFNEFGDTFATAGIDANTFFAIMESGLQSGARNTDEVANAFNELLIKSAEMGEGTEEAFGKIGISAEEAQGALAEGGDATLELINDIVNGVVDGTLDMTDAEALMGTFGEEYLHNIDTGEIEAIENTVVTSAENIDGTSDASVENFEQNRLATEIIALGFQIIFDSMVLGFQEMNAKIGGMLDTNLTDYKTFTDLWGDNTITWEDKQVILLDNFIENTKRRNKTFFEDELIAQGGLFSDSELAQNTAFGRSLGQQAIFHVSRLRDRLLSDAELQTQMTGSTESLIKQQGDQMDTGGRSVGEFWDKGVSLGIFPDNKEPFVAKGVRNSGEMISDEMSATLEIENEESKVGKLIGKQFDAGIARGMNNATGARDASTLLARTMIGAFDDIFVFGSPSKTMIEFGKDIDEGLAIGLDDSNLSMEAMTNKINIATPDNNVKQAINVNVNVTPSTINIDSNEIAEMVFDNVQFTGAVKS